jgi:threonine/homoserine/homoserine lactone efflux protein
MMSSLLTLSVVGLLVGFIFSMPIAGPISILITSNALKGKTKYCNQAAIGAAGADFIYVFCAVLGLTKFYTFFRPAMPYILFGGMIFLFVLGFKIAKTNMQDVSKKENNVGQGNTKNGLLTGFLLNFLNPTLFISWLTSSFVVITLVASFGFNTAGLNDRVDQSFNSMNSPGKDSAFRKKELSYLHIKDSKTNPQPGQNITPANQENKYFSFFTSLAYAFWLSVGGTLWFFCLAALLAKNRHRVNIKVINIIIRSLGWALFLFGAFLGYQAISIFLAKGS